MSAFSYIAILTVPFSALNVILINRISRTKVEERKAVAKAIERWMAHTLRKHVIQIISIGILLFGFFSVNSTLQTVSILFYLTYCVSQSFHHILCLSFAGI